MKTPVISAMEIKEDRGYTILRMVFDPPHEMPGTKLHGVTFALKNDEGHSVDAIPVEALLQLMRMDVSRFQINIGGDDVN